MFGRGKNTDDRFIEIGKSDKLFKKVKIGFRDINHHIQIIGQPGSGKSVLLRRIYKGLIENGYGLIHFDLKSDLDVKRDFEEFIKQSNRENDLVQINLSQIEESSGFNPLKSGTASEIKDKIMMSLEWSEVYYKKVSERVLLGILKVLVELRDKDELDPDIDDIIRALTDQNYFAQVLKLIPEESDSKVFGRKIFLDLKEKEVKGALSGLITDLETMRYSEFGKLLTSKNSLNLLEAVKENKVILCQFDTQKYQETSRRLSRMLLSELRWVSGEITSNTSRLERPKFSVLIDEFSEVVSGSEIGSMFVGFLNKSRGAGLGCIIAHQSLGDIKDEFVRSQILDSTESTISFTQKDPETCEILSSIVGTETKKEFVKTVSPDIWFSKVGSEREVEKFKVHPNVFKRLDVGEFVYFAKKPSRFAKGSVL